MFNYINIKKKKQKIGLVNENIENDFLNEQLEVKFKDYYFSNVIARSSKTMLDCYNSKSDIKRTGTEG
jgi:NADH-quinone oxidoreductase subunit G